MNKINIVYIGEFDFSRKNASTKRVFNVCRALAVNDQVSLELVGYGNEKHAFVDDFKITNAPRGSNKFTEMGNFIKRGYDFINILKDINKKDIVIYYGTSSIILLPLMRYCKNNGVKLIVDVVEWYDYGSLPLGKYGPFALNVHYAMTKLIMKADGIFAISNFLKDYFAEFNQNVILIPVLSDANNAMANKLTAIQFDKDYLNLIYAGTPGKKDLILNMINPIEIMSQNNRKIKLHILGPSRSEMESKFKVSFSKNIVFHGKIPQNQVPLYLSAADFSILLRPNKRYANAGFSTKFVESLENGLPVLANLTSDLGLYLKEGYNGYIVETISDDLIIDKLNLMLALSKEDMVALRLNAKNSSKENFDYKKYSGRLLSFVKSILNNND